MDEHVVVGRYGVRKGAWSEQEDVLLKECVEKYGEGKWHQVPIKSGLNRCRKSCRLRWLNYLKPNIKRGEFSSDEADLMIRLHKLLGNRWSLIAGRLPGRTANDVKNYWNTHLRKKAMICLQVKSHPPKSHVSVDHLTKVIRPRPRIFSKSLVTCLTQQQQQGQGQQQNKKPVDDKVELVNESSNLVSNEDVTNDQIQWWKSLLNDETDESMNLGSFNNFEQHGYEITTFDEDNNKSNNNGVEYTVDKLCMEYEERQASYNELSFNINPWDFLSDEW